MRRQMPTAPRRRYSPRMPPSERREQLLDAALELIADDGYGGVSMEAVARRAGVTKPVVYGLFSDRGALLRALLEREETRAFAQLAEVIPSGVGDELDPDQLLVDGFEAFLRSVRDHPRGWRLILLPVEGTPAVVREHVERGRRAIAEQLVALVRWGVEARGGPRGMDVELAAQAILGLGEQAARLTLEQPDAYPPERFRAFAAGLVAILPHA
jgi:AcrR family transcriptional regulator